MIQLPQTCSPLSLHDALPISVDNVTAVAQQAVLIDVGRTWLRVLTGNTRKLDHWSGCTIGQHDCHLQQSLDVAANVRDRKSTRLNSSHVAISYAVFCLNKKII